MKSKEEKKGIGNRELRKMEQEDERVGEGGYKSGRLINL